MASEKQRKAAKQNVKKAQATWQGMANRQHSAVRPKDKENRPARRT